MMALYDENASTTRYFILSDFMLASNPNVVSSVMWPFTCICSFEISTKEHWNIQMSYGSRKSQQRR